EEKNIVGSIEFLEVVGLEGSTYKLQGPNGEEVKLNQSEVNEEDELTIGEEYSFFIYPNRSGALFATQNMQDITTSKYDFVKVLKADQYGAHVEVDLLIQVLIQWINLPTVKYVWPTQGDELLVTSRIDSENHIYARLATETIVDSMYTPVHDDPL